MLTKSAIYRAAQNSRECLPFAHYLGMVSPETLKDCRYPLPETMGCMLAFPSTSPSSFSLSEWNSYLPPSAVWWNHILSSSSSAHLHSWWYNLYVVFISVPFLFTLTLNVTLRFSPSHGFPHRGERVGSNLPHTYIVFCCFLNVHGRGREYLPYFFSLLLLKCLCWRKQALPLANSTYETYSSKNEWYHCWLG